MIKVQDQYGGDDVKRRAIASVLGVVSTALISAFILWRWMNNPDSIGQLGLSGVFLASMTSHLTVVARDMFVPLFLPMASIYHPLILGISAGVGAAIGEVTTYFLGWGVAESLVENPEDENRLTRWVERYGLWAILLVALTPLPDTPIVLLAGSSRLPFWRLFTVECVGKTALYSLGAVVGGIVFSSLTGSFGGIMASFIMVAGSLLFCILVTWGKSRDLIFGWFERLFL
jgi:membrane protein YqaA with SNARE-associated domain